MEITTPSYYNAFRCLAGGCPDSCCKEWAVQVDDAAARLYRQLPGDLGNALRLAMIEEDGDTVLALTPDGRCPMWRQDGLCRIQAQLGEEALCHTCRQFPRLRHDYGNFVELGLELSCPEAARLILKDRECALVARQVPGGDDVAYDEDVMAILRRSRRVVLDFLQQTDLSVGHALAVLLLYSYAVQDEIDGGNPAVLNPAATLAQAKSLAAGGSMADILAFYQELEILNPSWKVRLASPVGSLWCEEHRAMARYFILRYWLQAVSDYDLVSRVKLTVVSCLVVKALGGNVLETAQLYSKEIENDPDNVDALLDGAYATPALADIGLLRLLLEET